LIAREACGFVLGPVDTGNATPDRMVSVAEMRRHDPEPPPGPPRIEFKPGMANQMLRELAPLLAEEGIDISNMDVADIETLQHAMNRAVERRNMTLFTPVGDMRELAVAALRLVVEALAEDDTTLASAILDQIEPESPDNSAPTVSACIGIALGLLDDWLGGREPTTPERLADQVRLPKGHWLGERAARDILALAGKGRAFRSLGSLITRHGGPQVLHGNALALTATIRTWSDSTGTPVPQLARTAIR
jgi:hypothetical protein